MTGRARVAWGLVATAALTVAACKTSDNSSSGNPGSPSPGGGTPVATTITITSSGVSHKNITVPRGSQVTFINSSSIPHEMDSDPHPAHTDCPEINQVGFITPGQTKLTGNLNTPKTCRYHDHNRDSDTTLQGTIVIQ